MILPATMVKAAIVFSAKNDVRDYLCGIHITTKFIEATNGHVAIQMKHGIKGVKKGVYIIKGRIPAKTINIEFIVTKKIRIVRFLGVCDLEIGVGQLEIISKKFPELQEKIIKVILRKPICNDSIPRLNASYIGIVDRAFKLPFVSCDMEFRGEDTAVIVRLNGYANEAYGNPLIIIMPVNKSK